MTAGLTDDEIIELAGSWDLLSIQDGGRVDRSALIGFVREVASRLAAPASPAQPSAAEAKNQALDEQQIEWSHVLQSRLIEVGKDQDHDVQNIMAEAACLLASLTSRPGAIKDAAAQSEGDAS